MKATLNQLWLLYQPTTNNPNLPTPAQKLARLELPATGWERRYRVRVHGTPNPEALASLRRGMVVDGVAYVSGMTARSGDPKALAGMDEYAQARVIFGKIKGLVEAAGGAMADVVKITVYVTDIANNTKVWQARREFFTGELQRGTGKVVPAVANGAVRLSCSRCIPAETLVVFWRETLTNTFCVRESTTPA
mgnify:CR=1 FL=1